MNVTVKWDPPLQGRITKLEQFRQSGLYESVGRLAATIKPILLEGMRANAPVRTGRYQSTIRVAQYTGYGEKGVKLVVYGDSPLSSYIIKGTRAHVIQARNAKYLRWTWADGSIGFAQKVNHPGTKPNQFPARAWTGVADDVRARMHDWGRNMVAEMVS